MYPAMEIQMASQNVTLIEVGKPSWSRFMIYDDQKKRYWCKGRWKKRRRHGELWDDRGETEKELAVARASAEAN
jgi:hypothetical protein